MVNFNFTIIEGYVKGDITDRMIIVSNGNEFTITLEGKLKDTCQKYLSEGSKVLVSGKLLTNEIKASEINFLTKEVKNENV